MARSPRILIVESEPAMRGLLADHFAESGYLVLVARDGYAARRLLRRVPVDAIVTEVRMPGGGLFFLRQVHNLAPDAAVIVLTAYGTATMPMEVRQAGARGYLSKPASLGAIHDAVQSVLHTDPVATKA